MEMFREITDMVNDAKRMDKRQFIFQVLSFGMVIASAFMIWKGKEKLELNLLLKTNYLRFTLKFRLEKLICDLPEFKIQVN